jgi:hypothetical protein
MLTNKEFEQIRVALTTAVCMNISGYGKVIHLHNTLVLLERFTEEEIDAASAKETDHA